MTGHKSLGAVRLLTWAMIGITCLGLASLPGRCDEPWKPGKGPLLTRWAADVSPERVHPEYPRPQMVRDKWLNLNGLWHYAITPATEPPPTQFTDRILVPFPIESALSGVMKSVPDNHVLTYRRKVTLPASWKDQRVLLHFGAVDWQTVVSVNGRSVGPQHFGGYDPFTLDITDALRDDGDQELTVRVSDPTDAGTQPRGKQVRRPHGIWYTPTTGIWQTVWLEAVPKTYIGRLKIEPDVDRGAVHVTTKAEGNATSGAAVISVWTGGKQVAEGKGKPGERITLKIPDPQLWSPDRPFLYDLKVALVDEDRTLDSVTSYCGLRKIALGKDRAGLQRLMLNNQPLFQFGPLDQGFWPDGLYTAPTDEALRYDIEVTKRLGFNMARKHVKVEPDRWYYWCDKLGLLVWQDMPSGDRYIGPNDPDIERSIESAMHFEAELRGMIEALENHPSIVMWVPFNEGWGQYNTAKIARWVKELDPSRLVNSVSGWADRGVGDVHDIHIYPGPGSPKPEPLRAAVLGEFGGLGLPMKGHTWQDEKNWGYRSFTTVPDLTNAYRQLIYRLHPLIGDPGLAAAVYTQTTDVEIEVNGLMTYDRAVIKMDPDATGALNRRLYQPPPKITPVVPTAQRAPIAWRYTTKSPAERWMHADFDDSSWQQGEAGFGEASTPGSTVRTPWKTPDIWLRRKFSLPEGVKTANLQLLIHHDEDAEIYVNGQLVAKVTGYTVDYSVYPLNDGAAKAFRAGENTIAVHCHQTGGGQYIDLGFVEATQP